MLETPPLRGVDTTFLIEVEILESPRHLQARTHMDQMLRQGAKLAVAPQVLSEFVHIATDPKRFARPLEADDALARAQTWWRAKEVKQVLPTADATDLFLEWMRTHRLGRKRILDTQLAATYRAAGITEILSSSARDFSVFGCFTVISPSG